MAGGGDPGAKDWCLGECPRFAPSTIASRAPGPSWRRGLAYQHRKPFRFIFLSIYLSIYLYIYIYIYEFTYTYICLLFYLCIYIYIYIYM